MTVTFQYDVVVPESDLVISSVTYEDEITEEQAGRLKASWKTGKYTFMDEDSSIWDIYDMTRSTAIEFEKQEEHGELIGIEVFVENFAYPDEIKEEA